MRNRHYRDGLDQVETPVVGLPRPLPDGLTPETFLGSPTNASI